ncbi:hypothetical protein Tco_1064209, partial [Tanacetum coccineum]
MVTFLSKPAESEGFEQIANLIKYALTINPTIYSSCIKQFWATVKAKTINEEVQLQALVDGKKVIITEYTVRRDLHLEDVEGVDCLLNATIFEQLTLMGYDKLSQKLTFYKAFFSLQWKFIIHTILQCLSAKTTAWNEFSSTMASAIICLATNQKFNFSKYIFESMVKNLDSVGKFLMYSRFIQVFLNKQVNEMSKHNRIYVMPSHTKKIFRNMKRVGKGFSRSVTLLFPTMMVQAQEEMGEDNVADEAIYEEMDDSLERVATTATSLDAEQDRGNINKTQSKETLNEPSSLGTSSGSGPRLQETMGILLLKLASIESSKDEGLGEEDESKQGRIDDIDANEDIYLVNVHRDEDMFRVNDLEGNEVIVETEVDHEVVVETEVASKDVNLSVDEGTLAQVLAVLKSAKPKADKVMLQEPEHGTIITTTADTTVIAASTRPKANGLAIHEEEQATRPTVSSQQPSHVKANIDVDYQLAQILQAQEPEELTDEEKTRLFVQFLEQRRKHFAAKRAKEKRNRPPTRAQQRSI